MEIVSISGAGLSNSAYSAAKFGLEGWIAPAGILELAEQKAKTLQHQAAAVRTLSGSLAHRLIALPIDGVYIPR